MTDLYQNPILTPAAPPDNVARVWFRVGVLFGLSIYFAYNIYTGNLANYINARFVWLSYVATFLFFALAAAATVRALRSNSPHLLTRSTGGSLTWGVLLTSAVPLILGVMVPSTPLGAEAINGSISTTAVRATGETAFTIAPENRNVLDWLRSFNDSNDFSTFNGQPVDAIGFIYREPDMADDEFMLARFTVSCCVADASALGLPIRYDITDELNEGAWVQVQGTLQVQPFGDDELPVVQVASIEEIPQPDHPYLYP